MPGIKELSGSFRHALHETRDVLGSSAKRMVSSTEAAWSRATDGVDNMSRRFNRFTNRLNSWADNNRVGAAVHGATWARVGATVWLVSVGLAVACLIERGTRLGISVHILAQIGRYFRFRERNAKFTVELRAGTIIFLMVGGRVGGGFWG